MSAEDLLPLQSPPRSPAPSLFVTSAPVEAKTLLDLMYDGFYLIFLLRSGQAPESGELLRERIKAFLLDVERGANKLNSRTIDVRQVKYAFCATVDETILRSDLQIRTEWQRQPLQLQYFGDQLGGERFFTTLENTRREGVARLQVLEVFHMCLLMGFQGKYVIEGLDQLNFLTARLGDEIAHHKGKRAGFAPHWAAPDQVIHRLRNEVPLWVVASVFLLFFVLAYTGFRLDLGRSATSQLASYHQLIKVAPEPAHVTITLP
ncbi:MAG: type IVB secretion system protein IcmH/DotU [Pseudomonadota bacterium]